MIARAGVVLLIASVSGCTPSAPTSTPTTSGGDALSVEENQQGHPERAPTGPSYPMTTAPLANTYLWCEDSAGSACLRAAAALGSLPVKNPANAPPALYSLEDLPDDCTAPGIAEIRTRLDGALGVDPTGWRDQSGNRLDAEFWPNIYSAAGCISDVGSPVAKIAASSAGTPRLYLIRVWESG